MAKVDRIIDLLEMRIARGDYALTPFPPEMRLASENGVSRMTARKAMLHLLSNGLLERDEQGRLGVTKERISERPLHVGFFSPMLNSSAIRWRHAAEEIVMSRGGYLRFVPFFHWNDSMLLEALDNFDGIFLGPPAEELPLEIAERLRNGRAKVVITGADYSHLGIASVNLVPTNTIPMLLDHLAGLGHRNIAAFNVQPMDSIVQERLEQWKKWLDEHSFSGQLLNKPTASYGDPFEHAYQEAKTWLSSGELRDTAVLCITLPAAIGLMRVMGERGWVPGKALSLCCSNDEGLGRFLFPAVTSIKMPEAQPLLRNCVDWMAGENWNGPLFKIPEQSELLIGETTGVPS